MPEIELPQYELAIKGRKQSNLSAVMTEKWVLIRLPV